MNIRIKDIARLSGVSVSTVSKIMNDKAESIAESTRLKVLQIAREHRYTPYSNIKQSPGSRRYILGLVASLAKKNLPFIRHLEKAALEAGYKIILSEPAASLTETEKKLRLMHESCDGLIVLEPDPARDFSGLIADFGLPAVVVDGGGDGKNLRIPLASDWAAAARAAAEHLARFGHLRAGLLASDYDGWKNAAVKAALEQYCSDREMLFDHKLAVTPDSLPQLLQVGATALICADPDMAALFYAFAWEQDLPIPAEMSVIALGGGAGENFLPPLSAVRLDFETLAENSVEALTSLIEGRAAMLKAASPPTVSAAESVAWPENVPGAAAHILVVGALNLDVVMNVPRMPSAGDTALIDSLARMPGGKGANQAIGVARLGGEVSLIGRIGRDAGGRVLYNALRGGGVNTRGISVDRQLETGRTYINVDARGESLTEVYMGANQRLEKRHLERNEALFRSARYCLIQSELPRRLYSLAVDFAHKNGAKVIFKPCGVDSVAPEILAKIHLMVPNQKEAARLAGMDKNIEEQAVFFLEQGVEEVIITLAEQGCFHSTRKKSKWYAAYEEPGLVPLDTAGASDAFISALALALAEGRGMEPAILYAQAAAALSVSQKGAQASLPNRAMLEKRSFFYQPK